jgi:hypothetical protein
MRRALALVNSIIPSPFPNLPSYSMPFPTSHLFPAA